jgi:hypothetical protein
MLTSWARCVFIFAMAQIGQRRNGSRRSSPPLGSSAVWQTAVSPTGSRPAAAMDTWHSSSFLALTTLDPFCLSALRISKVFSALPHNSSLFTRNSALPKRRPYPRKSYQNLSKIIKSYQTAVAYQRTSLPALHHSSTPPGWDQIGEKLKIGQKNQQMPAETSKNQQSGFPRLFPRPQLSACILLCIPLRVPLFPFCTLHFALLTSQRAALTPEKVIKSNQNAPASTHA